MKEMCEHIIEIVVMLDAGSSSMRVQEVVFEVA